MFLSIVLVFVVGFAFLSHAASTTHTTRPYVPPYRYSTVPARPNYPGTGGYSTTQETARIQNTAFLFTFPAPATTTAHVWPVLPGVSVIDVNRATNSDSIAYGMRDFVLPPSSLKGSASLDALFEYWRAGVLGKTVIRTHTTFQGKPALLARVDHPVSGSTTTTLNEIVLSNDHVYWFSASGHLASNSELNAFVAPFELLTPAGAPPQPTMYTAADHSFSVRLPNRPFSSTAASTITTRLVPNGPFETGHGFGVEAYGRSYTVRWFQLDAAPTDSSLAFAAQVCSLEVTQDRSQVLQEARVLIDGRDALRCTLWYPYYPHSFVETVIVDGDRVYLLSTSGMASDGLNQYDAMANSFRITR